MMKNKRIERRIYELLGVNIFRKNILFAYEKTFKFFHINVGYKVNELSVKGFQSYKSIMKRFAISHLFSFILLLFIIEFFYSDIFLIGIIIDALLNGYCIMVQRYNTIRINELLEKMELFEDKRKEKLKKDLRKQDLLIEEHVYKVMNNKKEEAIVTFEELLEDATMEQLKQYREWLLHFQNKNQEVIQESILMPIDEDQTVKLELKKT